MAIVAVRLLVRFGPDSLPRMNEIAVDGATIAWVALLSILASFAFAAIPLLRRGGVALSSTLREGGRGSTAGRSRFRARNTLMAGQVALALVLLVASGLMVRSFLRLRAVNPGFTAENVLTFDVSLTWADFSDRAAAVRFHDQLLERMRVLPGVESVGAATCLPLVGGCWGDPLQVRGRPIPKGTIPPLVQIRRAMPGYFETMRIPLVKGRTLEPSDHEQRIGSMVISRRAAELYFPNEEALGQQMGFMFETQEIGTSVWYTVVGVVENTPVERLEEDPYGIVYFPALDPQKDDLGSTPHNMAFAVRTRVPPMSLAAAVRSASAEIHPNVALGHIRSMEMIVADGTARMAFTMLLLLIAGGIALVLGAVGIYGVISYVVGQRRNEIGVRMALGARPGDVSGMVLKQSGSVVGVGIVLGLAGAVALSRVLTSLLFGVSATDLATYAGVTIFLGAIAALASWLPARRAAALDPLIALKAD
jgi:predicted permease